MDLQQNQCIIMNWKVYPNCAALSIFFTLDDWLFLLPLNSSKYNVNSG
jgi:hypothetical protein